MEEVAGVEVGGEIGSDELFVLSTGLAVRMESSAIGHDTGRYTRTLTTTVPLPQRPFQ